MSQNNINPVYAIGAIALIGGLLGSFLWTQAANLGTQFDLESRLTTSEQASSKKETQQAATQRSVPSAYTPSTRSVSPYDVDGALLIRYTTNGFSPSTVNASLRQVIRFRNDSNTAMRIAPGVTPPNDRYYSDLEQGGTVGKGGTFDFGINQTGVFPFTNLNNTKHTGLLVVTPQ